MRRGLLRYVNVVDNQFIITVKSDNAGTSGTDQFTIPTTTDTYLYSVETSDGYTASGLTGNHTITFPSGAGTYDVLISGDFPIIFFNNGGDRLKILDIKSFGFYSDSTSQIAAFYSCSNLTITAPDLGDFSLVTAFTNSWRSCTSLTLFPLINTESGTNFISAWQSCSNLTSFPLINTSSGDAFNSTWSGCSNLTSFPLINTSSGTNFTSTWSGCNSLTSFPLLDTSIGTAFNSAWFNCTSLTSFPLLNTGSANNFNSTWRNCTSLTSFPLINTINVISFASAWRDCNGLTSFPLLNTSSAVSLFATWENCSALTSFPLINTISVPSFTQAWNGCTGLTSFPLINTSSGTSFASAWRNCSSLTSFPSNMFDGCLATNFTTAFTNTALTEASIDGILVSINSNGTSGGTFNQTGGSAPSIATGRPAIDAMRARGWTVTVTGEY